MISSKLSIKKTNSLVWIVGLIMAITMICLSVLSVAYQHLQFNSSRNRNLPSDVMENFELDKNKIEFAYPENWLADLTPDGMHGDHEVIAFLTAPAPLFQNIIVAQKYFAKDDMSAVAEWGESRNHTRFTSLTINSLTSYSSESIAGLVSDYLANTGSVLATQNIHCKDLYFLHMRQGYAFSFCAYEKDWSNLSPTFNKIIDSIRFLE